MALADHPLAPPPRKGPLCSVCALTDAIDPGDRETLIGWLSNPKIRYQVIADAVKREFGEDIQAHTYASHSRGGCAARIRLRVGPRDAPTLQDAR